MTETEVESELRGPRGPSPREAAHLEHAHHEICTALTVMVSNVELLRVGIHGPASRAPGALDEHLSELESAVERMHGVARLLRAWRAP